MSEFNNKDANYAEAPGEESGAIAVIGMSGVFPGAESVHELWEMLREGRDGLIPAFEEQGLSGPVAPVNRAFCGQPDFVDKVYGLKNKARFDAAFFGISPREAELMDPQHRIFLENAWAALEHACVIPDETDIPVGVYGACGFSAYLFSNLPDLLSPEAPMSNYFEMLVGNDKEYLATRTSYKLNLTGPSLVVQSACSSSLAAIILACQSLRDYQCDLALAGGSSIQINQDAGYMPEEGSPLSLKGVTRAFDDGADGVAGGSGCAVVVLKRLEEALRDGDVIYSVIRGYGLNNDGADKVNFTAPSVSGQSRAIAEAMAEAGISPREIGYIECHGTGTALGDPIEIASLSKIFKKSENGRKIPIGTIKTNVGHLDTAAGAAALIKTSLALHHEEIPPSLNFEVPNARINFAATPFEVCSGLKAWPRGGQKRYAAISSFGFGGTNAHLIVEEGPKMTSSPKQPRALILPFSARSAAAAREAARRLAKVLPGQDISAVASTLQRYRKRFDERLALVAAPEPASLAEALKNPNLFIANKAGKGNARLLFGYGGCCTLPAGAAAALYADSPVFAQTLDRLLKLFAKISGRELRPLVLGGKEQAAALKQPENADPAAFILQSALTALFEAWGLKAEAVSGSGQGLLAAACAAGVLPEQDALGLLNLLSELAAAHGCAKALQNGEAAIREKLAALPLAAPRLPLLSGLDGRELTLASLSSPDCWLESLGSDPASQAAPCTNTPILDLSRPGREQGTAEKALESLLREVARLWTLGFEPDWEALPGAADLKSGLPGYAFEGERYWRKPARSLAAQTEEVPERASLDDWFMEPVWMLAPALAGKTLSPEGNWLILHSEKTSELAEQLAALLPANAGLAYCAKGGAFAKKATGSYSARPGNDADMADLVQELAAKRLLPGHIVLLWGLEHADGNFSPPLDAARLERVRVELLDTQVTLMRHLSAAQCGQVRLSLFAPGIFDVGGDEPDPLLHMIQAPLLTAMWEHPEFSGAVIDTGNSLPEAETILFEALSGETVACKGGGMARAWRNGVRWLRNYLEVPGPAAAPLPALRGPVLITGGLGGVGLAYANMLAKAGVATLVLAGRRSLPPESEWAAQPEGSPAFQLHRLKAETGANLIPLALDCADAEALAVAIAAIEAEYGEFAGLVHAAGLTGSGMIASGLPEGKASNFHAKLASLRALDEIFKERRLEFVQLCSSLSAIQGALGQVDNCAANLVLDGYAHWARKHRPWPVTSVNWDRWQSIGMARAVEERHASVSGEQMLAAMRSEDAQEAARRLLGCNVPQVLAGNRCPFALTRHMLASRAGSGGAKRQEPATLRHARPDIETAYAPPKDDLEKILADLWSISLGISGIGADDEFTRLGGDSLLAISLMGKVRKTFRSSAPLHVLFRVKTVSGLAGWLRDNEASPGITDKIAGIIRSTSKAEQAVIQD